MKNLRKKVEILIWSIKFSLKRFFQRKITTHCFLLTHTDADGAGSAWLAKHFFGEKNVTVWSCSNKNMDKEIGRIMSRKYVAEHTNVFVTDISCSKETAKKLEKWLEKTPNVSLVLLDHHKTSIETLKDFSFATIKVEKDENSIQILPDTTNGYGLECGTSLFCSHLVQNYGFAPTKEIIEMVNIITAYDTWMWVKNFGSDPVYKKWEDFFHAAGGFWKYLDIMLEKCSKNDFSFTCVDEEMLSKYAKEKVDYVEAMRKNYKFYTWHGFTTCLVEAEMFYADVFNNMFTVNDIDIAVIKNGKSMSLRCRKDGIDVGKIAKMYGGGGHTQASGFTITRSFKMKELVEQNA